MLSYGHTIGENPTYVTSADRYRISFLHLLTPGHPDYTAMVENLFVPSERERSDGYGLAFLESEEHSVTFIGPVNHVAKVRAGDMPLDVSIGSFLEFWPQGANWDTAIPDNTWSESGIGIFREFAHRGTSVIAYEYVEDRDEQQVPMLGWHCLHCHRDELWNHHENHGPQDRRWIAAAARKHIRNPSDCRPVNPLFAEVVTAVANEQYGTNNPVVTHDSRCATSGCCAQIRHLRATAAAQGGNGETP